MSCNPFKPKLAEWDGDFQRSNIVARDTGAQHRFRATNPSAKHFNLFKIDGNIVTTATKEKCDFLLIEFSRNKNKELDCKPVHSYFIELKGSNLRKANEQVLQSIKDLYPSISTSIPHARIILKRINTLEINSIEEKKLIAYIKQRKGTHKQFIFNNNSDPEIL